MLIRMILRSGLLGVVALPSIAAARDLPVASASELATLLAAAQPGDTLILADGVYDSAGFSCTANGTAALPITVRAKNPLGARVRFDGAEGFKVSGAHWHFEDLSVQGVCATDSNCEHGFHVFGAAEGFVMRRCKVFDFNAQLKVNSSQDMSGAWLTPHRGLIEGNELYDSRARSTSNPTTKLNIDTGDDWIVRANYLHDFQKAGGDNVSYGAFMKSGGSRGTFERNLVICSQLHSGGTRIGLSLGGGGTDPRFCAPAFNAGVPCSVEHSDGILRNNVLVNCTDVGIYLNRAKNTRVLFNTLIATNGVDFRFDTTSGEARGNLLASAIRRRDGAAGTFANNLENVAAASFTAFYQAPLQGDLRKRGDLSMLIGQGMPVAEVSNDYCARSRSAPFDVGALQHSLGDCDTTRPPLPPSSGPGGGADGGTEPAADGGEVPTQAEGCSCSIGRSRPPSATDFRALLAPAALGLLALRRRSRRA